MNSLELRKYYEKNSNHLVNALYLNLPKKSSVKDYQIRDEYIILTIAFEVNKRINRIKIFPQWKNEEYRGLDFDAKTRDLVMEIGASVSRTASRHCLTVTSINMQEGKINYTLRFLEEDMEKETDDDSGRNFEESRNQTTCEHNS